MGTFTDHQSHCQGDKESIEKARKVIERFQRKNAKYSGNGNCDFRLKPVIAEDGKKLSWGCYTTGGMADFTDSLKRLTNGGGMKCFHYVGCTDGTNEGWLLIFADGKVARRQRQVADIGLRASMANASLASGVSVEALGTLIDVYKHVTGEGRYFALDGDYDEEDDDGDWTEVKRAVVLAGCIGKSLRAYPELLSSQACRPHLVRLLPSFVQINKWAIQAGVGDASLNPFIPDLIASLESIEIAAAAKKPKAKAEIRVRGREAIRI